MTAIAAKPIPPRPPSREAPVEEQHFYLGNVSWESYLAIGAALADRPGLRMTYDRGNLEFMTTSRKHELFKTWLDPFIIILAEELDRPIEPGGNMTFQREGLQRALEGDACYWIEHESQMRGKLTWEPEADPPPDLFLEIEVSRNILDRLAILAALRVPEVWAFDGATIRAYRLQEDGTYHLADKGRCFPEIPLAEIVRFIDPTLDYLTALRNLRAWVRKILGKPALQ